MKTQIGILSLMLAICGAANAGTQFSKVCEGKILKVVRSDMRKNCDHGSYQGYAIEAEKNGELAIGVFMQLPENDSVSRYSVFVTPLADGDCLVRSNN
jgi:hypothetical protein